MYPEIAAAMAMQWGRQMAINDIKAKIRLYVTFNLHLNPAEFRLSSYLSEKSFVPISESYLATENLGINYLQAKIILDDLVTHNFLVRDKSTYRFGKSAWSYKPVYTQLDAVTINKRFLNKKTDLMLDGSNISSLNPELKSYGDIISKINLDAAVYERMNYILGNRFYGGRLINNISNYDTASPHLYGGGFIHSISGHIYNGSLVPSVGTI